MNSFRMIYNRLNRLAAISVAVVLLPLLMACEHKELCYDHSHTSPLEVVFDWGRAPGANPATMSLYLFPEDGSELMRYEFTNRTGGTIDVPNGVYDAICLNSDKETHRLVNMERMETFEVTTGSIRALRGALLSKSDSAPLARGAEAERSVQEPEALWTAHAERIHVRPEMEERRLLMIPKAQVINCTVEVHNVENLRQAKAFSASLTGMAGGWRAGIDELTDEKVTIPFEVNANIDKSMLTARLTFFGHCPRSTTRHKVMIYVQMSDGSTYFYEEDVTDQVHSPLQDPTHIRIVLKKLSLPKPTTSGGGLQPTVKEWEEVRIDVPMS